MSEKSAEPATFPEGVDLAFHNGVVNLKGVEHFAGDRLAHDLFVIRQLTATVVARVRQLVSEEPPRTERALEAATAWVYLGALLDDLRAADAVLDRGYVNVSLSLVAGLMDGIAMLDHYGLEPSRAEKFAAHDDPDWPGARTGPHLRSLAKRVAPYIDADPEKLAATLADWYQFASAAKHKNPLLLQEKIRRRERAISVSSGPSVGGEHTERAAAALSMGVTIVLIGGIMVGNTYAYGGAPLQDLTALAREFIQGEGLGKHGGGTSEAPVSEKPQ